MRQPLAQARAGQRSGTLSIFDDRLGRDVRLRRVRRRAQAATVLGAAVIIAAGLYIFLRERKLGREEAVVSPPA